jgi:hypothetical protein
MFCVVTRITAVLLLIAAAAFAPAAAAEERSLNTSGEGFVDNGGIFFGQGEATHLGRSYLTVGGFMDYLSSGSFVPFGGSLESANRNFLDFAFDEEFYSFDPATGVIYTTVTFTGGTGRFEDVTGSADVMIIFDPNFHSFLFLIDGSIDY